MGAPRSFTWAQFTAGDLAEPLAEPTTAELQAYYDANIGDFTLPESKRITYAILTPDMIIDQVEVDETALRALFEDRADEYNKPERRLVERLVFGDAAKAGSAKAQLDVNGTTFELLVQDRGLDLGDIDLGDVTRPELDDAADAVFAASVGDIVGPLPSALGPALFRVNAVLPAQITTFEEAHDDLQDELASDRARRLIDTQAQTIDDLLAGGATLQELPDETDMKLGQIDWTADTFEDIAAYGAFRQAAAALTLDDFPEVEYLDDGGVFAMRLDEVLDARPQPFDDALPAVIEGWSESATAEALSAQVTSAITALASGGDFAAAGLSPRVENGLTRSAFIEETPPQFMSEVFQMNIGEVRVLPAGATVVIVRLTETLPADTGGDMGRLRDAYEAELNQSLSQALFDAFARDAQLRARPQIDQRALNAVLTSFQ